MTGGGGVGDVGGVVDVFYSVVGVVGGVRK